MSEKPVHLDSEWLEIHDPELDTAALMAEIETRIAQRRAEKGLPVSRFPTFGPVPCPDRPVDIVYDPNLYHYLRQVNRLYHLFETDPHIVAAPTMRIPVISRLWALIRHHAHILVLFYVNRAVRHQTTVNRSLVSVLNLLTSAYADQQRQINALQAELDSLRQQSQE